MLGSLLLHATVAAALTLARLDSDDRVYKAIWVRARRMQVN